MEINSETPNNASTEARAANPPNHSRSLRIWPGIVLAFALVGLRFGPRLVADGESVYLLVAAFGPLLCCLLIVIWWVAASRATGKERVFGFLGILLSLMVALALMDPTMRGPGMLFVVAPFGLILFVLGVTFFRDCPPLKRTGGALSLALIGCCLPGLLRNDGMTGDYALELHWRWTPTSEEQMLAGRAASSDDQTTEIIEASQTFSHPEWSGFRGPHRSGQQVGPAVAVDWDETPPEQLWKIAVGPGWGSFAVAGDFLFTQEQRGPMECVVCYDAGTGRERWAQQMEARFDDPMGGPGPRTTPTVHAGSLFALGATGNFMRLNPVNGEVIWTKNLQEVAGRKPPMWGFSSSPLLTGSMAIVHAGGEGDKGILAFDVESGRLVWSAASGDHSYSSAQVSRIAGEESVLMLSNAGVDLLDPVTGQFRLRHEWPIGDYRALQPNIVGDDVILLPTGSNKGTRAIRVKKVAGTYSAEELWTSRDLKPDFSDFVVFESNAYGFDGGIFASVDLETGNRNWKGGRYGKGQVLLLKNSGLLLVAAERGDVVLLKADPSGTVELASFKALEGKTWNHPVVVGDRLYIRNAQEAACFRLQLARPDNPQTATE